MEIAKNRYGRVSWTLRDGKWVRPETGEVDSSPPPHRDADHYASLGRVVGVRPREGDNCFKPSEDLLRSLNRAQDDKAKAKREKLREGFIQIERDFDSGKRRMDPDVHIGTGCVAVPTSEGGVRYVREDRVPEAERLKIAKEREEARLGPAEPVTVPPDHPAFDGQVAIFEGGADAHANTTPAGPVPTLTGDWATTWPTVTRNDAKRML